MTISYVEAITLHWPACQVHAYGPAYEDLVWDAGDAIPSQEDLDAWIAANPDGLGGWKITNLSFRNRFTMTEKITIEMASIDNPAQTMEQRQTAAMLRVYMRDIDNASFVDLSRTDTKAGVQLLETYGIIASGRANTILTTVPTEIEIYKGSA